jgi:prefoldin subunit 5
VFHPDQTEAQLQKLEAQLQKLEAQLQKLEAQLQKLEAVLEHLLQVTSLRIQNSVQENLSQKTVAEVAAAVC